MRVKRHRCYTIGVQRLISRLFLTRMHRFLSVAPMMGCTDRHCRSLLRILSPNAMLYSEMVTTGALIHGDRKRLLSHASDEPCAVQLGGSDPEALALSAKMVEE
ncbi:MAG: hypothetical protein HOE54_07305, partial [Gammaproteobacteria bacterium]|nr:hypothetical protein [Gammaproteobacteria bacterium]